MPEEKHPLLIALYEKLDGTARFAPYVDCSVSALMGRKPPEKIVFKARIDTGADTTCIPAKYAKEYEPLLNGRPQLTRFGDGRVSRSRPKLLIVTIHFGNGAHRSYRPNDGVILRDVEIGLIGMDILRRLDIRLYNDEFSIRDPQTGGGK